MPYKNFKNIEIFDLNKLVSGVTLSQHRASPVTKHKRRHQTPSTQGGGAKRQGPGQDRHEEDADTRPGESPGVRQPPLLDKEHQAGLRRLARRLEAHHPRWPPAAAMQRLSQRQRQPPWMGDSPHLC